jgi:hypothetical protein
MGLLNPIPPPYDALEWNQKPFPEKSRMVCEAWAAQGYGTPLPVYVVYALKVALYVFAWVFFCGFTPGLGALHDIARWWLHPTAFQKAILWSMLFEVIGLGCGSGPLTGRYFPPVGGFLYFLRPGTTRLPLFPTLPLFRGVRRTLFDVALYLAYVAVVVRALVSPAVTPALVAPLMALVPLLTLRDKTVFLASRGEHYFTTLVCFVLASDWIPGAKAVQLALWFWAGFSKLNHHFPAVVCVMTSNSPVLRLPWFRRRMYRDFPRDLRPSRLAEGMAHAGTALEFSVPLVLGLSHGGVGTTVGLVLMLMLHGYITSNVPMGVPIEWNVMVVYGAFFLFGAHASSEVLSVSPWYLAAYLAFALIALPLAGNLWPRGVSFLVSMRYYAGNWAFSQWIFKGESFRKLDRGLVKSAPWVYDQLDRFYDRATSVGLVGKVLGFRAMHLHGRTLRTLLPKTVASLEGHTLIDGEIVAGLVLGWNFGDGHLHNEQLLAAVQAQCGFEEGELRCVFVESQPFLGDTMAWSIHDAHAGLVAEGEARVADLRVVQPWDPPA